MAERPGLDIPAINAPAEASAESPAIQLKQVNKDLAGFRRFGPCDNAAFYRKWLTNQDPLFDKLFVTSINCAPFTGNILYDKLILEASYIVWYGQQLVIKPSARPINVNSQVAAWGDLLGPLIAKEKMCEQAEARKIFVCAMHYAVQDAALATLTRNGVDAFDGREERANAEELEALRGKNFADTPIETAVKILMTMARNVSPAFESGEVSMLVHVYLAVLKRGSLFDPLVGRIISAVRDDLNIQNLVISPDACKIFYEVFGRGIEPASIALITSHMRDILPQEAVRLYLTLGLEIGDGMIALRVTGRAIRMFTDFDWGRVVKLYPDEWTKFNAAVTAVGSDLWYGFRHNLGPVRYIKYKSVTHVAKELLIKVNGERKLQSYRWFRGVKFQDVVDTLIANYMKHKSDNVLNNEPMPLIPANDRVDTLRDLIMTHQDVYT